MVSPSSKATRAPPKKLTVIHKVHAGFCFAVCYDVVQYCLVPLLLELDVIEGSNRLELFHRTDAKGADQTYKSSRT